MNNFTGANPCEGGRGETAFEESPGIVCCSCGVKDSGLKLTV